MKGNETLKEKNGKRNIKRNKDKEKKMKKKKLREFYCKGKGRLN